jgi:DoxX-like family
MNLTLWIVAGLLAVVFLASSAELFGPKEEIARLGRRRPMGQRLSPGALEAIGALELLAAAVLILPGDG